MRGTWGEGAWGKGKGTRPPLGYMRRSLQRPARWALFLALVAGIVAMHGLGHAGHSAPMPTLGDLPGMSAEPPPHAAHSTGAVHSTGAAISTPQPPAVMPVMTVMTGPADVTGMAGAAGGMGLDPTSVCLAVLAAAVLLPTLGGALLWRKRDLMPGFRPGIVSPTAFSGLPPPRKPELSALSVLRL